MKTIYLLSGLGANERVFQFLDLSGFHPVFLQWMTPLKDESMEHYAKRLSEQISEPEPILIGLSFGGMMAMEIAKHIHLHRVILISSAKTYHEIPLYYRMAGYFKLNRLVPSAFMKRNNIFLPWFIGLQGKTDKQLFNEIRQHSDPLILKWSIEQIINWKNETVPGNLVHIHGDKDRTLPLQYVKCDIVMKGAGHFMTVNRAAELSEILRKLLLTNP